MPIDGVSSRAAHARRRRRAESTRAGDRAGARRSPALAPAMQTAAIERQRRSARRADLARTLRGPLVRRTALRPSRDRRPRSPVEPLTTACAAWPVRLRRAGERRGGRSWCRSAVSAAASSRRSPRASERARRAARVLEQARPRRARATSRRWIADEYCSTPARALALVLAAGRRAAAARAGPQRCRRATATGAAAPSAERAASSAPARGARARCAPPARRWRRPGCRRHAAARRLASAGSSARAPRARRRPRRVAVGRAAPAARR